MYTEPAEDQISPLSVTTCIIQDMNMSGTREQAIRSRVCSQVLQDSHDILGLITYNCALSQRA